MAGDPQRQFVPDYNLDKNWAWPTLVAVTATIFLTSGPTDNLGVLLSYWIDYFDTSKATASWVPSIHTCCFLLAAPFASIVAPMFSYRKMVILGAVMTFTGWTVSFFATEIWHLYITLGLIAGIGSGTSSFTAYALLPLYFDRKKQLASSVVQFGNAIASVFLPIVYSKLTEKFSWQGTVLLCGGFTLNLIPAALLILDPVKIKQRHVADATPVQLIENAVIAEDVTDNVTGRRRVNSNNRRGSHDTRRLLSASDPAARADDADIKKASLARASSGEATLTAYASGVSTQKSTATDQLHHQISTGSAKNAGFKRENLAKKPRGLFGEVLRDKRMWLLAAHTILMDFFFIKLFLVVRYATEELHYTMDEAALLLSFQAGGILFARTLLVMTTLFSRSSFLIWSLFHLGTLVMGVCIILYPHILPVMSLFINEILIGFGWGAKFGLLPGVTMDVMGREKFGVTWALMASLATVSVLFSPPLAGWLTDRTGSFKTALYISGICQILSVIPALILQYIHYGDEQQRKLQLAAREWGYDLSGGSIPSSVKVKLSSAGGGSVGRGAQWKGVATHLALLPHSNRRRSSEADAPNMLNTSAQERKFHPSQQPHRRSASGSAASQRQQPKHGLFANSDAHIANASMCHVSVAAPPTHFAESSPKHA